MRFAWDTRKAERNRAKHGITFEEATTVFGDPLSETFDAPQHSLIERRFILVGTAQNGKILMVAHTDDGETVRIISARELTRNERKYYEERRD